MRIIRFSSGVTIKYGVWENSVVSGLKQNPFLDSADISSKFALDGTTYSIDKVRLLAPCTPSKIVCLGVNYKTHADEMAPISQASPIIFLKPPTTIIGPGDNIILPLNWERVDYEGELAIVIGKKAKNVQLANASDFIFGYTCLNDVTERAVQSRETQWTRAKGYDTFAPIGPCIETELNSSNLKLETYVNGIVCQSSSTDKLIHGVSAVINYISEIMTLLPGDIIATGTPGGIGPLKPGDVVEVKIEGIGTLSNKVVNQE
jgi:2-keto-4-pentenoate hydratase/2-oxohepta-3-ene-1,7-dioic acid hydratase in catechol pathway